MRQFNVQKMSNNNTIPKEKLALIGKEIETLFNYYY